MKNANTVFLMRFFVMHRSISPRVNNCVSAEEILLKNFEIFLKHIRMHIKELNGLIV